MSERRVECEFICFGIKLALSELKKISQFMNQPKLSSLIKCECIDMYGERDVDLWTKQNASETFVRIVCI